VSEANRWRLATAWTLLIVAACSIPGTDLPKIEIKLVDKIAHFGLFVVFAWLWLQASSRSLPGRLILVIGFGTAFGFLTEWYQGILPWERTPDMMDALANTIGLIVGSLAFMAAKRGKSGNRSNL